MMKKYVETHNHSSDKQFGELSHPAQSPPNSKLTNKIILPNIPYTNMIAQIPGPITSSHPVKVTRLTCHTQKLPRATYNAIGAPNKQQHEYNQKWMKK